MEIYTVGQINAIIKNYVESSEELRFICVEGEVSNITYQIKHMYMTLKDNSGRIKCAAFSYMYNEIPRDLKEGDKVKVYGAIKVYDVDASIQIVTKRIEKFNVIGELYQKLEILKKEYQQKGYFDESLKKPLPKYPRCIGVVTSDTGDAIRDIIKNTHNRDKNVMIYLYPAKVQGEGSASSIAKGIEFFNKHLELNVECVIVGRGGGSIEDLWAFNEREVIEAIHESNLPIISAVGHEADNLISDLVADKRASTPTHAPHSVISNRKDIDEYLFGVNKKLSNILMQKIYIMKNNLDSRKNRPCIAKFYDNMIKNNYEKLEKIQKDLNNAITRYLEKKKNILENTKLKLTKYNVDDIFERGFSVTTVNGRLIKDIKVKKGDILNTKYLGGNVNSEVK